MTPMTQFCSFSLALFCGSTAACKDQNAADEQRASATPSHAPAAAAQEDARESIDHALESYEQIRAKLAADDVAVLSDAASLQRAATEAFGTAPAELMPHLDAAADAAERLKQLDAKDPKEIRRTFGEVSKAVVALMFADPTLRADRHLFECPMAPGYKKWVQVNEEISNPYMGAKMLQCGSSAAW